MAKVTRLTTRVDGYSLSVRVIAPSGGLRGESRGTVILPPLIGGSGLQQYSYFRGLNRRGYTLATFEYRGHGKSEGRFSVATSISDSVAVVRDLRDAALPQPFFGVGDCYAAIPLLIVAHELPGIFRAVALINAVPTLQFVIGPREMFRNYFRHDGHFRFRNPLDLRGVLAATNSVLFPEVDKSRDHFGILRYDRTRTYLTAWEYLRLDPLAGITLDVPSLVTYGTSDSILGLDRKDREAGYCKAWRTILPESEMRPLADIDHYFSSTLDLASEVPHEFFARVVGEGEDLRTVSVTPAIGRTETTSSVA